MAARTEKLPRWKQDERRAIRLDVTMKACLREPQSSRFDVDIFDLSVKGCRLGTSALLRPGSRIYITVPGIVPLEAAVAWREGHSYGCAFVQPLHAAVLDHIARKFRKA